MLKTALVILTLGSGGTTHMALSEAESLDDCRDKADVVGQVLTASGYSVAAMRCGETGLDLTPYSHGYDDEDLRWHYLVTVKGDVLEDGFDLLPVEPGSCQAMGEGQFCAVSAQGPAETPGPAEK